MGTPHTIGFTGSRHGLDDHQRDMLTANLRAFLREGMEFHHGQCVGADEEAARIARQMGYRIVSHPPKNPTLRSSEPADETWPPEDYLARNRMIVDEVDILIAAPRQAERMVRSGSWSTIRYAEWRWPGKLFIILSPAPSREDRHG